MSKKNVSSSTPYFPRCRPPLGAHLLKNNMSDIADKESSLVATEPATSASSNLNSNAENLSSGDHGDLEICTPFLEDEEDEWEELATSDSECDENYLQNDLEHCDPIEVDDFAINTFNRENTKPKFEKLETGDLFIFIVVVVSVILTFSTFFTPYSRVIDPESKFPIRFVRDIFPHQSDDLWWSLSSGTDDVLKFKRPTSYVWLYEEKSTLTVEQLLNVSSRYIQCKIRDCSASPIVVTAEYLNSPEVVADYGLVISKYRELLAKQGLMIIKNLEKINGTSALAFHSLCDEVTPVVPKSLFIFTMKVEKMEKDKIKFVEKLLRKQWSNIKTDLFHPLFTRISGMVIEIKPYL